MQLRYGWLPTLCKIRKTRGSNRREKKRIITHPGTPQYGKFFISYQVYNIPEKGQLHYNTNHNCLMICMRTYWLPKKRTDTSIKMTFTKTMPCHEWNTIMIRLRRLFDFIAFMYKNTYTQEDYNHHHIFTWHPIANTTPSRRMNTHYFATTKHTHCKWIGR